MAVPERFGERVGEAKHQHVVHRPLPEEVIDAENTVLIEYRKQNFVQFRRGFLIVAERFFDDYPRVALAVRFGDILDHGFEQHWRNRQIISRARRVLQLFAQRRKSSWVLIIAIHIAQQRA